MNGSYISVGSSFITSGLYGLYGWSYEYRYKIFSVIASVGAGLDVFILHRAQLQRNVIIGYEPEHSALEH